MANTAVTEYKKLGIWDLIQLIENRSWKQGSSTLNATNEKFTSKSNAIDERAYIYYTTFVPRNATIEVEFFARAISGKGTVGIDLHDAPEFDGDIEDFITITDPNWRPYRIALSVEGTKSYARVIIGQFKSYVGETEFRDIVIKVYNGNTYPVERFALIRKDGSKWDIHGGNGEFANQGVRYVVAEDDYIRVRFAAMRSWYRPIVMTTVYKNTSHEGWHCNPTVGSTDYDEVNLYISDKNGNIVNPKDITGPFYVAIHALSN